MTDYKEQFKALSKQFDVAKTIIAEDLGVITDDVVKLREDIGAPGMSVLQFAFDGNPKNPHIPHNHYQNSVCYSATHDNETTLGWFRGQPPETQALVCDYLRTSEDAVSWAFIQAALGSVADTAVIPLQDIMSLDNSARMNTPGKAEGNWGWVAGESGLWEGLAPEAARLKALARMHGR